MTQLNMYGLTVSAPNRVVPTKNSTFVIIPSLSAALDEIVMLVGAVKVALPTGLVMSTVGGKFAGALTVMLTKLEIVMAPELSVAFAVML